MTFDRDQADDQVELEHLRDAGRALYLSVYIHYCLASIHPVRRPSAPHRSGIAVVGWQWSHGQDHRFGPAHQVGPAAVDCDDQAPPALLASLARSALLACARDSRSQLTVSGNETDLLPLARVLVESTRSAFAFLRALPRSLDDTNAPEPSIKIGARPRVSEPLRSVRI